MPDMVLLGKGLTAGVSALSAVIIEDAVMAAVIDVPCLSRFPGTTHSGNPVSCAAAIATLEILGGTDQTNLQLAASMSLGQSLQSLSGLDTVRAVRGWGHMWGVEVEVEAIPAVANRTWVDTATAIALRHQLLIHPLSIGVIPVFPALVATTTDVSEIVKRLAAVLADLSA
jgi:adenosylmethionine-8-amino-7-oxononanoate aminotransferase